MARITTTEDRDTVPNVPRSPRGHGVIGKLLAGAAAIVAVAVLIIVLAAVSLLPRLTTRSGRPPRCAAGRCCSSRSPP